MSARKQRFAWKKNEVERQRGSERLPMRIPESLRAIGTEGFKISSLYTCPRACYIFEKIVEVSPSK